MREEHPLSSRELELGKVMESSVKNQHYKALPTYSERVDFPIWQLSHTGQVVALAASDDFDDTGYLDYVISGGSNGYAHIWSFDGEGSQTYRLFAKLYHDPVEKSKKQSYRVTKPLDKLSPVGGNAVVAASAAPRCCVTGTQDGRVFAWLLREEAAKGQALPPLSLECLLRGCASTQLFKGQLAVPMQISLLDYKRNLFGVVGHVYESAIVITQVTTDANDISLVILHKLATDHDNVMSIAHVPGHKSLVVACGTRDVDEEDARESRNEDGTVSFLKVWKIPHPEENQETEPSVMADAELPLGEMPLEIVVSAKRRKFGGFRIAEIHSALDKQGINEDLRKKEMLIEGDVIPQNKIHECVASLVGRKITPAGKILTQDSDKDDTSVSRDHVDELLVGLGLRTYSDATTGEAAKGLPLKVFQDRVKWFPEQLIVTAGIQHTFTTELRRHGEDYSLKMLPDHHTRKDVVFMNADTVGRNAVTVDHHICEVWPLDDFGDGNAGGLKLRVSINELVNPCKVTAPLWVASTARGREGGEMDQLLCGLDTGAVIIWDMFGMRGGEMIAELRSSNFYSEVLLPPFLELITFIQLTSFAFASWNSDDAVAVPRKAGRLFTIDLHSTLTDFDISFHRSTLFWTEVSIVLPCMALMIFYVVVGGQEATLKRIRKMQSSASFAEEETHLLEWRNSQVDQQEAIDDVDDEEQDTLQKTLITTSRSCVGQNRSLAFEVKELATEVRKCYCTHITVFTLKEFLRGMSVLVKVICTILVVPISKIAATIFDCDYDEDKGNKYLAVAPDIQCYVGLHRYVALSAVFIVPTFFFILMPYAVCGGDVSYVQRDEILRPVLWQGNAEKKASVRYTGFLHPMKEHYFFNQLVTFIQKIAFPVIVLETTSRPLLQKVLLLILSVIVLTFFVVHPSVVSHRARALIQGSKLLTVYSILVGTYAIYSVQEGTEIGHDKSLLPTIILSVGSLVLLVVIVIVFCLREKLKFASVAVATSNVERSFNRMSSLEMSSPQTSPR